MPKNSQQIMLNKGLIDAAAACSILKVRTALHYGANPNFQDSQQYNWTALHFSCYFSMDKTAERICKELLSQGALTDLCAMDGTTPLMAAASVGSIDVVRWLIESKCNVNAPDKGGKTPLMGAADRGSMEIALALLTAGATAETKDGAGLGAIEMAQTRGHHEVASAIERMMISSVVKTYSARAKM